MPLMAQLVVTYGGERRSGSPNRIKRPVGPRNRDLARSVPDQHAAAAVAAPVTDLPMQETRRVNVSTMSIRTSKCTTYQ
jgi:hypothetical protein